MEKCPLEIWTHIFSFACTDDGSTGRKLCYVSKLFYETSKPVRLQSITLTRYREVLAFAAMLPQINLAERRIAKLVIGLQPLSQLTSDEERQSEYSPSELDDDELMGDSEDEEADIQDEDSGGEVVRLDQGREGDESRVDEEMASDLEGEDVTGSSADGEVDSNSDSDLESGGSELESDELEGLFEEANTLNNKGFPNTDDDQRFSETLITVDEELKLAEGLLVAAVTKIVELASPAIQDLTVSLEFNYSLPFPIFTAPFPQLTQLILGAPFERVATPHEIWAGPIIFPSLTHFCIDAQPFEWSKLFRSIAGVAPRLEYLHIPYDQTLMELEDEGERRWLWHPQPLDLLGYLPKTVVRVCMESHPGRYYYPGISTTTVDPKVHYWKRPGHSLSDVVDGWPHISCRMGTN